MDRKELRERQDPVKQRYKEDPDAALVRHEAQARLGDGIDAEVSTWSGSAVAGLHPAAGGDGSQACSGDMLLEALAACAGVTLRAVATAMGVEIRGGEVRAEGDLDYRGTLAVSRDAPVGFREIRLHFHLDTPADEATRAKLLELTERYCVVQQTVAGGCPVRVSSGDPPPSP